MLIFTLRICPHVGGDSYRVEVLDQPLGDLFRHVLSNRHRRIVAVFPATDYYLACRFALIRVNLFFTGGDFAALLRALKAGFESTGDNLVCVVFTLDAVVFDRCPNLRVRQLLRVCSNPRPTRSLPLALFNVNH